jgi:type VI protein secretion system component Hcp
MKKLFFLALAALCFGFTTAKYNKAKSTPPPPATAGIFLYFTGGINSNGLGESNNGHPDELELNTYTGGEATAMSTGAGIPHPGNPEIADLILDKLTDKGTQRLRSKQLIGQLITTVELRIYNGFATNPVYKIAMSNVYVTNITSVARPCESGGCMELHEVISLHPTGTIAWSNYPVGPTGNLGTPQVVTYNIATDQVTSNGL